MDKVYTARIMRVGSSLGLIIPKPLLKQLNIERGDTMVFGAFSDGVFAFRRVGDQELRIFDPPIIKI